MYIRVIINYTDKRITVHTLLSIYRRNLTQKKEVVTKSHEQKIVKTTSVINFNRRFRGPFPLMVTFFLL